MAGVTGLEPAASGVTGRRSNQLSYTPILHISGAGLMRPLRWGPGDLMQPPRGVKQSPLHFENAPKRYLFSCRVVGGEGLEPPTLSV